MGIQKAIQDGAIAAEVAMMTLGTPAQAVLAESKLPDAVKEQGMALVENFEDAIAERVKGEAEGEDAAASEPVPEPESSVLSDPPESANLSALDDAWTDADALADLSSDLDETAETVDIGDPGMGGVL